MLYCSCAYVNAYYYLYDKERACRYSHSVVYITYSEQVSSCAYHIQKDIGTSYIEQYLAHVHSGVEVIPLTLLQTNSMDDCFSGSEIVRCTRFKNVRTSMVGWTENINVYMYKHTN